MTSDTLDLLRYQINKCHACPLGDMRDANDTRAVPAEAGDNYHPGGLAIFAEAPGAKEALVGRPMVGAAGDQLNELLDYVGLSRDKVVIISRVRGRPPNNKIKSKEGVAAIAGCDPWVRAELDAYNPGVVLLMGATALELVFGKNPAVGKLRGSLRATGPEFAYGERLWVATAHPAAVLHGDPHWLPLIMQDMALAKGLLSA